MSNIPTFNVNDVILPNRYNFDRFNSRYYNRGNDNKVSKRENVRPTVGLYTVDNAILKYLQNKIKPTVIQDNKQIQVPVIYGSPERWKSAQRDGHIRDKNGKILLPIIMIKRTNMQKENINSPVNKYQVYSFKTGWNPRTVYDRFTALNRVVPSEIIHTAIIPDYYKLTYEAVIWTEYMEQMNKLVEDVSFESYEYWGDTNNYDSNYRFRTVIESFNQETEVAARGDRMIRNKFNIDVKAYILPQYALDGNYNRRASTKINYSPKKLVFTTEIVTGSLESTSRVKGSAWGPTPGGLGG